MRRMIYAKPGHWLTQSEKNTFRPRIFMKLIPVNYPDYWEEWTEEQYQEYIKEHGEPGPLDILKYYKNFDYSKTGGFFGEINK